MATCVSAVGSSLLRIYGCGEGAYFCPRAAREPEAPIGAKVDLVRQRELYQAAGEKGAKLLDFLFSRITRVTQDEFLSALKEAANPILDLLPQSVVLVQPNKSQLWVAQLVSKESGLTGGLYAGLDADELEAGLKEYAGEQGACLSPFASPLFDNVIIFDDGAFSGTQMFSEIRFADIVLSTTTGRRPHFHVVVPYMSRAANEKLQSLSVRQGIQITTYSSRRMYSVAEIVSQAVLDGHPVIGRATWQEAQNAVSRCLLKKDYKELERKTAAMTLHVFAHKQPDGVSFPEKIRGALKEVKPPYKT